MRGPAEEEGRVVQGQERAVKAGRRERTRQQHLLTNQTPRPFHYRYIERTHMPTKGTWVSPRRTFLSVSHLKAPAPTPIRVREKSYGLHTKLWKLHATAGEQSRRRTCRHTRRGG